jgi:3',5'-nucleoside bisphosphate phosphatase
MKAKKTPKTIDLHMHSYFSDGENSPEQILERIKEKDISLFAITDHNFLAQETAMLASSTSMFGIEYIQGIEVSCIDKMTNISLHILGYSLVFDIKYLNKKTAETRDGYNRRAKKIIDHLNEKYPDINLDFNEMRLNNKEVCISRNTLAARLQNFLNNPNMSRNELLKEVFVPEDNSWMLDSLEAIEIIRKANGVAVLAHPGRISEDKSFESMLFRLISYGLRGIEVYHSKHTQQQIQRLLELATKYNIVATAGSDWHGNQYSPHINLGMQVAKRELDKIYAFIRETESRTRVYGGKCGGRHPKERV